MYNMSRKAATTMVLRVAGLLDDESNPLTTHRLKLLKVLMNKLESFISIVDEKDTSSTITISEAEMRYAAL